MEFQINRMMKRKDLIEKIKDEYTLYFAGYDMDVLEDKKPFGLETEFISVLDTNNSEFFELLNQLDGLSYGCKDLAMPKWVGLDCGLLPSVFVGLGKRVDKLPKELKEKFDMSGDYNGLVPLTEYCAIQKKSINDIDEWISHTLASIVQGEGLGLASKIIGLKAYGANEIVGIAQYDNPSLKIHSKISDLELISAKTPPHSDPDNTFIYKSKINKDSLLDTLIGNYTPKDYDFLLEAKSKEEISKFQNKFQNNDFKYKIVFPGHIIKDDKTFIPIKYSK